MTKQSKIDRCKVVEAAKRQGALLDVGNAFQGGPFSEDDLAHLALACSVFDVKLMVADIRQGDPSVYIELLRTMAAMMWATGFKTGIDAASQEGTP